MKLEREGVREMKERRRFPRYRTRLDVEYEATNGYDIQSKTSTIDISEVGVSIPVNKIVEPGRNITMRIKIPDAEREVSVIGKVVWRRSLDEQFAPEENAGIEFVYLDGTSRKTLRGYLHDHAA